MISIAEIVKYIQYHTGENLEQIASKIGYSRPHLNRIRNSGEENDGIRTALIKSYPDLLQNVSREKMVLNFVREDQAEYKKKKSLGVVKEGQLAGMLLRNTALLTVILNNQAEMIAKADGKPVAAVLASLENAVQQTEAALVNELSGR